MTHLKIQRSVSAGCRIAGLGGTNVLGKTNALGSTNALPTLGPSGSQVYCMRHAWSQPTDVTWPRRDVIVRAMWDLYKDKAQVLNPDFLHACEETLDTLLTAGCRIYEVFECPSVLRKTVSDTDLEDALAVLRHSGVALSMPLLQLIRNPRHRTRLSVMIADYIRVLRWRAACLETNSDMSGLGPMTSFADAVRRRFAFDTDDDVTAFFMRYPRLARVKTQRKGDLLHKWDLLLSAGAPPRALSQLVRLCSTVPLEHIAQACTRELPPTAYTARIPSLKGPAGDHSDPMANTSVTKPSFRGNDELHQLLTNLGLQHALPVEGMKAEEMSTWGASKLSPPMSVGPLINKYKGINFSTTQMTIDDVTEGHPMVRAKDLWAKVQLLLVARVDAADIVTWPRVLQFSVRALQRGLHELEEHGLDRPSLPVLTHYLRNKRLGRNRTVAQEMMSVASQRPMVEMPVIRREDLSGAHLQKVKVVRENFRFLSETLGYSTNAILQCWPLLFHKASLLQTYWIKLEEDDKCRSTCRMRTALSLNLLQYKIEHTYNFMGAIVLS